MVVEKIINTTHFTLRIYRTTPNAVVRGGGSLNNVHCHYNKCVVL